MSDNDIPLKREEAMYAEWRDRRPFWRFLASRSFKAGFRAGQLQELRDAQWLLENGYSTEDSLRAAALIKGRADLLAARLDRATKENDR